MRRITWVLSIRIAFAFSEEFLKSPGRRGATRKRSSHADWFVVAQQAKCVANYDQGAAFMEEHGWSNPDDARGCDNNQESDDHQCNPDILTNDRPRLP